MIKRYASQVAVSDMDIITTDLNTLVGTDFVSASQEGSTTSHATIILDLDDDISAGDLTSVNLYMADQGFGTDQFGRYYHYAEDETVQSNTGDWVDALTLTSRTVHAGNYMIEWSCSMSAGTANADGECKFQIDEGAGYNSVGRWVMGDILDTGDRHPFAGHRRIIVASAGTRSMRLRWKSYNSKNVKIREARISMWRME